jgi:uncharacterized SAM-binding protein YcdF (DUF218 family)
MFLLRWATAPIRMVFKLVFLLIFALILYFVVTLVQVWLTSRDYAPVQADAIVVMGSAQYNGVPSPDLQARLDEALILYQDKYAPLIMCTGYKQPGDNYTEAQACAMYLESKGVPKKAILKAKGTDTWGNWSTAAPQLKARDVISVLVVTDPFHEDLSMAMASSLGFQPHPTPTKTSPIKGTATIPYFLKEAAGVAVGRIVGFSHLHSLVGGL